MLKKILKASALLLTLNAAVPICALGQNFKAVYTYDANGNRKTANIIYLNVSAPSNAPKVEDDIKFDESSPLKINIYPNPTQGDLRVELTGGNRDMFDNPSNNIKVWDMQGKLIVSVKPLGGSNRVDLTQFTNGTYIMHLTVNGVTKTYKILKN